MEIPLLLIAFASFITASSIYALQKHAAKASAELATLAVSLHLSDSHFGQLHKRPSTGQ